MSALPVLLAAAFLSVMAPAMAAEKYPSRPIRLIAPFPPGGGTDILSRILAVPVGQALGQTIVVDNRPGAGGAVGAEVTAQAEPDGYTLIMVSSSYAASAAFRNPPYDPVNGIQPIILIGTTPLVLTVHPSVPAKSVSDLIALARASPGKLNYATVGTGSVTHLAHELFKLETRTNLVHVPYKGGGPALNAVVAGEVQLTMISLVATMPHWKAGRLRPLGTTMPARASQLPGVPTISETVPGFEVIHWYGIWGPKGLPKAIVARWNQEVAKVLLTDEMRARTNAEGLESGGGPPEALGAIIKRDVEKWRRTVREAKITSEG